MKCKYKVRWFSSRGAFLILLWTLFIFIVCTSVFYSVSDTFSDPEASKWLIIIPALIGFVSAPLSGWLADAKFGNYKVFRVGAVLLFIATVMNCFLQVTEAALLRESKLYALKWVSLHLCYSVFVIGGCACIVTALPLGLDQMPDASSDNLASYIAWFVCNLSVGSFIGVGLNQLRKACLDPAKPMYTLIWALLPVFCMSIVLVSNFIFSSNWLIIEPKSPQSLKTIHQVLKFAVKHRAPLNRSALTYWEEDIPSRIDLGKSKYGGPFTTEEVEDVKTVLRLLAITLPFAAIIFSFAFLGNVFAIVNGSLLDLNVCTEEVVQLFLYSMFWYGFLSSVTHEFLIYPIIRNRLPSILKRIGAVSLVATFTSLICLILHLIIYFSHSNETVMQWITQIFQQLTRGVLCQFVITLILEFMCAQSPYNMRGLLLSTAVLLMLASSGAQISFRFYLTTKLCTQPWCPLVPYSVQLALHTIGFLLFCVVARWYKKRVRDDSYFTQQVVEEVYDRYLTAAAAQSRFYRATN